MKRVTVVRGGPSEEYEISLKLVAIVQALKIQLWYGMSLLQKRGMA